MEAVAGVVLNQQQAEELVVRELEQAGHHVVSVDLYESKHPYLRHFFALGIVCIGEPKLYDFIDRPTALDEVALMSFVNDHWLAEEG